MQPAAPKVEKTEFKDGKLIDSRVEVKNYPSIEHGALNKVTSIVLHRTDSTSAKGTLNAYAAGQSTGAHFLIDKDGTIYQTANLKKRCWHVGILYAKCEIEKNCDPKELKTINALTYEKGLSFSRRVKNVSRHETKKRYPERYPANYDSIGIEVVGKFQLADKSFEKPTEKQLVSVKWLVDELLQEYKLNKKSDVYAHGAIARKEVTEGGALLTYILEGRL